MGVLNWLLSGHTGLVALDYLINALFAFLGAATCAFAVNPRLKMPRRIKDGFEPGVLSILLIGVASGLAVGHHIPIPFLVGLVAPMLLPPLLNSVPVIFTGTVRPALVSLLETALQGLKGAKKE